MTNETELELDENRLIAQRREKLAAIRKQGNAFPNDFRRDALNDELHSQYSDWDAEKFKTERPIFYFSETFIN